MKKFLATLLAVLMVISMAACGSKPAANPAPAVEPAKEVEAEEVWLPYNTHTLEKIKYGRDATGQNGMVASSSWYATKAGLDVLKAGGNAADAAIAVSYTLGVTEPFTSGIGGGGFMTIYDAKTKKVSVVDFREMAPAAATADMFIDAEGKARYFVNPVTGYEFSHVSLSKESNQGGKAAGVPGEVAGLEYVLNNYGSGKFTRAELMKDAINYAENGYLITATFKESVDDEYEQIANMEECAKLYLDENGLAHEVGSTITNKDLAKSLRLIAEQGSDVVYKGEIAQAIAKAVQKYSGVMTVEDLANYKVEVREPVSGTYHGYKIYSLPPASSGGTHLIQALNILENFDLQDMQPNSTEYIHLYSEAFKLCFRDRSAYMADTAFKDVPLAGLTSKEYAKTLAEKIDVTKSQSYKAGNPNDYEHHSTTSFSIVDAEGNMIACTKTINQFFGSKVVVDGYGFIMNDEMDDFDTTSTTSVGCVEPGKRPLSSMSPSIILYPDGTPYATIGTPGGLRIWPTITQIVQKMIDYDLDVQEAINAARVFDNNSETICWEPGMSVYPITQDTVDELAAMGHKMTKKGNYDLFFGGVQGITIGKDGTLRGGADPRRDGKALAY